VPRGRQLFGGCYRSAGLRATENKRRQEVWRQEELITQHKRHNDIQERQSHHGGVILLVILALFLGLLALFALLVVGVVDGLTWLFGGFRAAKQPEPVQKGGRDLIDLIRAYDIEPEIVTQAIQMTLQGLGR